MLEPRPRPVSWNEARKASGVGRWVRRMGLLSCQLWLWSGRVGLGSVDMGEGAWSLMVQG